MDQISTPHWMQGKQLIVSHKMQKANHFLRLHASYDAKITKITSIYSAQNEFGHPSLSHDHYENGLKAEQDSQPATKYLVHVAAN